MSRLPRITGKKVISALRKAGFEVIRIKGSHHFLQHEDGRCTVVAVHSGETIGSGLMIKILNDCEMTVDDFLTFV
ncbi:type II toxin-antitoxin system HicA family toxin [Desulforegula conservatrix]|uniref:type II toxin-antitoxin system HicA family toxin n=1 Tax=Desulforegula conservatrix TaxID=153026 RepID=UPI0004295E0E|nr:type II toxin-antitoxin system HicA family toxin [Desulforegula conservatrix]